ncbi:hypothetical protein [Spelaeicoccus albus]|uniref:PH (Pleckstrin Homology) domain-containing protein n=1 Tax=Spelaeicoccus albus TaxID=1280376 RepID=A0A7Z0D3Z8_9MICO|nr:hypothetical protein [Spelaeicoccus albus]NYI68462.1 hypothetical protein [Spelaeicoccus albus]
MAANNWAPVVLKQAGGYWIPLVGWAFCAYLLIDALVRGAWHVVGVGAPWLLLIAAVLYALLWRPALIVGTGTATIRNPFVSYELPFADIVDVRIGPTVSVQLRDGGGRVYRLTSWNAPGTPKRRSKDDAQPDSQLLADRWNAYEADRRPEPVTRRLDLPPTAALVVCAAWSALSLVL